MNDLAVLNPFEQYFSHILGHLEGHLSGREECRVFRFDYRKVGKNMTRPAVSTDFNRSLLVD